MFLRKLRMVGLTTMMVLAGCSSIFATGFSPDSHKEPTPTSAFEYDLTESRKGIKITGYKGRASVIVVPATIEDFPVHEIRLTNNYTVKYIILSAHVNYVDMRGSIYLKEVHFVKDYAVAEIKGLGFGNCERLTKIHLPATVTNVKELDVSRSGITHLITWPEIKEIKGYTFCKNLKEVIIPETVISIDFSAFSESDIEKLVLSSNLEYVRGRAFSACSSLKEIVIPPELKSVTFGDYVFYGCSSLSLKTKSALENLGYTGGF